MSFVVFSKAFEFMVVNGSPKVAALRLLFLNAQLPTVSTFGA